MSFYRTFETIWLWSLLVALQLFFITYKKLSKNFFTFPSFINWSVQRWVLENNSLVSMTHSLSFFYPYFLLGAENKREGGVIDTIELFIRTHHSRKKIVLCDHESILKGPNCSFWAQSLDNFQWGISTVFLVKKWWPRTSVNNFFPWAVAILFLHTKGCGNAIPVKYEEISPCIFSINQLKNQRIENTS